MMLNKIKPILAISSFAIALSISGPAVAGGNSTANEPSTPTAAAVVAAIASKGITATAASNPDGTFTITVSGVTRTVSSASIATYLSVYD